jgi:hypothetical protein
MLVNLYISVYLLFLMLIFLVVKRKSKSAFDLYIFFTLIAIAEIPYLYFLNNNQEELHPYVAAHMDDFDFYFIKHVLLKMVFVSMCLLGMSGSNLKSPYLSSVFRPLSFSKRRLKFFSYIMVVLTILFFYLFLRTVGGLEFLILNISNKTTVVQGTAGLRNTFLLTSMLSVGFFIEYISLRRKVRFLDLTLLLLIVMLGFIILASSGERKNPIMLLIFSALMWNFRVSRIKLVTFKNVMIGFFLIFFASRAPVLRAKGAVEMYLASPEKLLLATVPYFGEVFKRFSEIDISLFIFSYFDSLDKLWFGASITDFFTGFIPSSFFPNKPPLDEGVYIYALAHYMDVYPPTPFVQMLPVGWPLSRMTGPYVNFGELGVVFFGFLTGMFLKFVSNVMVTAKYSSQTVFLYCMLVVTNFGFTNAFVFNMMTTVMILLIISVALKDRRNGVIN